MGFSSSFSSPSCGDLSSFSHSAFFFITTSLSLSLSSFSATGVLLTSQLHLLLSPMVMLSCSSMTVSLGSGLFHRIEMLLRRAMPCLSAWQHKLLHKLHLGGFCHFQPTEPTASLPLPSLPLLLAASSSMQCAASLSLLRKYECLVTVSAKMGKCPPPPSRNASVRGQERWVKPRQFKSKLCKTELVARVRP